jgi:hypothetical protein
MCMEETAPGVAAAPGYGGLNTTDRLSRRKMTTLWPESRLVMQILYGRMKGAVEHPLG